MRFCQVDGTPLVDDAPAFDPYATIVSSPMPPLPVAEPEPVHEPLVESPADAIPVPESIASPIADPVAAPIAEPEDVLDLPEHDPLKTVMVSDAELRDALGQSDPPAEELVIEMPAAEETPAPVAPSFSVPDVPSPSFGSAPPPSPFGASEPKETAPEPSVFDEPAPPPPPIFEEPAPMFDEAATMIHSPISTPFEPPAPAFEPKPPAPVFESPAPAFETPIAAPVAEWTPPPAPDANWQNQDIGSNTPFQPPAAGTGSVNQTLAIVSLILGIVSLCCYIGWLTGPAALITGFLSIKNINRDPNAYGGKGLAIAGMIIGGLFTAIWVIYWILIILVYAGILAGSMIPGR